MHSLSMPDENVRWVEPCKRARRQQPQQGMNTELLTGRSEIWSRTERLRHNESALLGPPERDLFPEGGANDSKRTKWRSWHACEGSYVQRHVVAPGESGAVAAVPVEELDHSCRPAERTDALIQSAAVDRIDDPHVGSVYQGMRRATHVRGLGGDPAEAELKLVAETNVH